MRPGWTLHEMMISLAVTGLIVSLASAAAVGQLRFFRGVGEVSALRTQVNQAAIIAAGVLRGVAGRADIHAASDSAIEVSVTIGSAVTCRGDTGRITVARGPATGNTLGAFAETPGVGDDAHVLLRDSVASWMRVRLLGDAEPTSCPRFPEHDALRFASDPLVIPAGTPVRFTRRTRLSLYRASDGRWYLGLKEWNGSLGRFNTIQPVAGPLRPYGAGASGLTFGYLDGAGAALSAPIVPAGIALVTITARGETLRPARVAGMSSASAPWVGDSITIAVAIPAP